MRENQSISLSVSGRKAARLSAMFVLAALTACGGGGGGNSTNASPPPTSTSVVRPQTKVLSSAQLQAVSGEDPAGITFTANPGVVAGDIVFTNKTALKVLGIGLPDATGAVRVTGVTPELEEAVSSLKVKVQDLQLTPDMFVPAEGVNVSATRASALGTGRESPQASTVLTLTLMKQLASGLTGQVELTFTPTVTYDIDSDSVSGTASVRGALLAKPSLVYSTAVELPELKILLGSYNVPIAAPPLPPGAVGLRIPIYLRVKTTVGEVNASLGATGQADYGVQLTVRPTDLNVDIIGNGLSFGSTDNFTSLEFGVTSKLDIRVVTGVSLSAMFGLVEPLSGLASAGVQGAYTYRKFSAALDPKSPIDLTCLEAKVDAVQDFSVNAKFFGLRTSKVSEGLSRELYKSNPAPACSTAKFAGPVTLTGQASLLIGNQCPGTYTITGTGTVNTGPSPTLRVVGTETFDHGSCYKNSQPTDIGVPLVPVGVSGAYTLDMTYPFTCAAPCVAGSVTVTGNLNIATTPPSKAPTSIDGNMRVANRNQTPYTGDASGNLSLLFVPAP